MKTSSSRIAPAQGVAATAICGLATTTTTTTSSSKTHSGQSGVAHEVVVLSPWLRRCLWFSLLVVMVVNVALLADSAATYFESEVHHSRLWFFRIHFLSHAANQFVVKSARVIATGYTVIACLFACCVVYLVYVSVRSRGLFFGVVESSREGSRWCTFIALPSFAWWCTLQQKISKARDLVSVQGPYFETRLLLDDILELFSQTAAAVAASHSISNVGLNLTYGVVIFLTSIVPFVSKRVFPHSLARRRMACLVADLVLEFVWGSVLPIWMAHPIRTIYNRQTVNTRQLDRFANPTREIERVLVLSWFSYLLSVVPFLSTLLNLVELQSILRHVRPRPSPLPRLDDDRHETNTTVLTLTYPVRSTKQGQHFLLRGIHILLPLYGLAVLITSIVASRLLHAETAASTFECIHRVNPWFMADEACVGRRINCSSAGIQGHSHEMDAVFAGFNAQALRDLFITDCPQLTFPQGIRQFARLESISVANSRIMQWNQDAAVVDAYFPELHTVKLSGVVFAELPTGLLAQPLASKMDWVLLAGVPNATLLLDSVGDHWKNLHFFNCVYCGLTEFPAALKTMRDIAMLQLVFNDIQEIPENWLAAAATTAQLDALRLDVNPQLKTLPDSLWRQAARSELVSLEHTGLTAIPEWLADEVTDAGFRIFAGGTPLCAQSDTIPVRIRPLVVCTPAYWILD